jgi:hypothetical protein
LGELLRDMRLCRWDVEKQRRWGNYRNTSFRLCVEIENKRQQIRAVEFVLGTRIAKLTGSPARWDAPEFFFTQRRLFS